MKLAKYQINYREKLKLESNESVMYSWADDVYWVRFFNGETKMAIWHIKREIISRAELFNRLSISD
jgi:hypothetical protein